MLQEGFAFLDLALIKTNSLINSNGTLFTANGIIWSTARGTISFVYYVDCLGLVWHPSPSIECSAMRLSGNRWSIYSTWSWSIVGTILNDDNSRRAVLVGVRWIMGTVFQSDCCICQRYSRIHKRGIYFVLLLLHTAMEEMHSIGARTTQLITYKMLNNGNVVKKNQGRRRFWNKSLNNCTTFVSF